MKVTIKVVNALSLFNWLFWKRKSDRTFV